MTDLFVMNVAVELPQHRLSAAELLRMHPLEADRLMRMGYVSVAVEPSRPAGALALAAVGRLASAAGDAPAMVLHASIHDQGMGLFWNPATAMQAALDCPHAVGLALRQGCDGMLVALQLAHRQLASRQCGRAVVVGSDRFVGSGFCRVTSDYGILYGDAAAAMVIGSQPGLARIVAIDTVSDPGLAALHDGTGFDCHDVRSAKRRFLARHGRDHLRDSTRAALQALKRRIFAGDDAAERAVRHIFFPHLGLDLLRDNYFPVFSDGEARSLVAFGAEVGHLGTCDQVVALASLLDNGALDTGDQVLLIGAGAGFCWTAVLLEIGPADHRRGGPPGRDPARRW